MRMASPPEAKRSKRDYNFIEEPSSEFFCPVTFDLLREPHQTLCCGNHLSQEAVAKLKGKPCPICKNPTLCTVSDKFYKRRVCELKLHCPNKSLGCEWVGELGSLNQHLEEGGCQYAEVACEFNYAGCRAKLPRQLLPAHVTENIKDHLSMVAERVQQLQFTVSEQQGMVERQQKQIEHQQQQIEQQQRKIEVLRSALHLIQTAMPDFLMTNFEEHKTADNCWFSPPFYSHIGGYKMCLKVLANGVHDAKGTHISMFVCLLRGEHDDHLKWPFCGTITWVLLNQRKNTRHWGGIIHLDDSASDDITGRVVGRDIAIGGRGHSYPIAHAELCKEGREYLKLNCLRFRIVKVIVKST